MDDLPSFNLHWLLGVRVAPNHSLSTHVFGKNEDDFGLTIVSLFNNQPYHVPPMALNLVGQALARTATGASDLTITTGNHPLPRTDTEKVGSLESFFLFFTFG